MSLRDREFDLASIGKRNVPFEHRSKALKYHSRSCSRHRKLLCSVSKLGRVGVDCSVNTGLHL